MKEEPSLQLVREVEKRNTILAANTISRQHAFCITIFGNIGNAILFRVLGPKGGLKSATWINEKDLAHLRDAINSLLEQQEEKEVYNK